MRDDQLGSAPPREGRPLRICWVADDEDEASYAGAARPPGVPRWTCAGTAWCPRLEALAGYDLLVVDPGALPGAPDGLVQVLRSASPVDETPGSGRMVTRSPG